MELYRVCKKNTREFQSCVCVGQIQKNSKKYFILPIYIYYLFFILKGK